MHAQAENEKRKPPENPLIVAKVVIRQCNDLGTPINNFQLQNILCWLQEVSLLTRQRPFFNAEVSIVPEDNYVRIHGVYEKYSAYGSCPIPPGVVRGSCFNFHDREFVLHVIKEMIPSGFALKNTLKDKEINRKLRTYVKQ